MKLLQRHSRNILANWWWTVDHKLLIAITSLLIIGVSLIFTASPSVATRIDVGSFHFVKKQIVFAFVAYGLMLLISMQSLRTIRRFAFLGYVGAICLMIATLFFGMDTKGASRWLDLGLISIQPSEFVKPFFVVVAAWLFDMQKKANSFPGNYLSIGFYGLTVVLLLLQPDVGMTIVVTLVWGFQFFLAGLSIAFILALGGLFLAILVFAYFTFSHVHERVDQFLSSENNLGYQVKLSLEAFESGSFFGRGPGEGIVKLKIPDAHTDFIFAVAGEEFGVLLCVLIIAIFAFIVAKTMLVSLKDKNLFIVLTSSGLAASFGLQGIINMASTLHLMPTKGMALPFISYGGSSLLATSILLGMLLAITRKNVHAEDRDYD
ncbi:MAG: putative peptidoglycan glycosyltransferase FtsW [Alphaproteobacteria bacterium]